MTKQYNLNELRMLWYGSYIGAEEDFYEAALAAGIDAMDMLNAVSGGIAVSGGGVIRSGTGAPDNSLGSDNDFYIATDTSTLYGPKASGVWPAGVSLIGADGADGANGSGTLLTGPGAPDNGLGVDTDMYLATDTTTIYGPKASGVWPAGVSLIGPAGANGTNGTNGVDGADGITDLTSVTTDDLAQTDTNPYFTSQHQSEIDLRFDNLEAAEGRIGEWRIEGALAAGVNQFLVRYRGPSRIISRLDVQAGTAPLTTPAIFDIGRAPAADFDTRATLWDDTDNRLTLPAGDDNATTTLFSTTRCDDGDVFELTVVDEGGTAAADVVITMYGLLGVGSVTPPPVTPVRNEWWPVLALDHTGLVVPTHAETDPVGSIYVALAADGGSDSNSGTIGSPVATLDKAFTLISSGGTIVVRAGTYTGSLAQLGGGNSIRDTKYFTLQSKAGEQVWFDGGGSLDGFATLSASTGLGAGTYTIRGIGFKNYATTTECNGPGEGTFYLSGGNGGAAFVLEDCVIKGNTEGGFAIFEAADGTRFERCIIRDHGSMGCNAQGSYSWGVAGVNPTSDRLNNQIVKDCYFARCNLNNHSTSTTGTIQAGIKMVGMDTGDVSGCIFEDIGSTTYGAGIWLDVTCQDVDIHHCYARRCARAGFFIEVDNNITITNCVADSCGRGSGNHGNFRIASPNTKMWHCTSIGGAVPLEIYEDVRNITTDGFAPDTDDVQLVNNLFAGPCGFSYLGFIYANLPYHTGGGTVPADFFDGANGAWDTNFWWKNGTSNITRWQTGNGDGTGNNETYSQSSTPSVLATLTGGEAGATDTLLTSTPFVNQAGGDITVSASSPASGAGTALPAEIAALVTTDAVTVNTNDTLDAGFVDVPIPTW